MNNNNYTIRLERNNDYYDVEFLTREAFWNVYKPGCDEHYFVHVMRTHKDFIPELAFVIELDGKIIGNIMYTKSKLIDENGTVKPVLSFGPISIHPDFQRKGYGKILLKHSLEKAAELSYDAVVSFGNPGNYVSSGFKSCCRYNICLNGDFFPTPLLVKELHKNVFDGRKWYFYESSASEPCGDVKALEEFDSNFPYKEKLWQPSQEEFFIYSHSSLR